MNTFEPHHLQATAEQVTGRVFLVPGSEGRARRIADRLEDVEILPSDRRLDVFLGRYQGRGRSVDLGVVSTGMGCPSLDIVVTELILLGARALIRVGTAGSMQPEQVRVGELVIATAAVRDEAASDAYVTRDFPATADWSVTAALIAAARRLEVDHKTYAGVIHSKDSLYAREFGLGPLGEANRRYTDQLRAVGVLASEMEAAHLFVLAQVHSRRSAPLSSPASDAVRAGAVMAVIGDDRSFAAPEIAAETEALATEVALDAALDLA